MTPHHIRLAEGRRLAIYDDAIAILSLLAAPQIDARAVFAIGRRLFEVGGLEPLEAIIDVVANRLDRDVAAELVMIWLPEPILNWCDHTVPSLTTERAMSDIPDLNYALVRRKPTADMLLAAVRAAGVNVDEAWHVFVAMVEVGEQELAVLDAQADAAGEA